MTRFHIAALYLLSFALATGCNLLPSEQQKSQSMESANQINSEQQLTIRRAVEILPLPTLPTNAIYRATSRVDSSSTSDAASDSAASGSSSVTIPMGVKLAALAIGLLALGLVVKWLINQSRTAKLALSMADRALASKIRSNRERAIKTQDPAEIASLMADNAEFEAERGKLRSKPRDEP